MSNHHLAKPAQFLVEPSMRLKYALVAAHGLALSACLISALPWPGKILLGLVLPVHLYLAVREIDARHDAIRFHDGSGLHVNDEPVQLLPSTVVTPFAIWLHFQPQGTRKKTLLIVNDAMPEHEFRQLIVKLKISAT
ncbi:protein YgfX [Methylomicrobium sp. Wu6]|uniref:protein YgfX n=1 Tax=Methylomicrobium sp. Wu6 TaxID=3107928 RepID=UPI002DD662C1|nr:protein YgfX [Methylomicrobium sp. Wu6]MEC4747422.1 protein YgfX [Methylomicrobium sp. Wu6]